MTMPIRPLVHVSNLPATTTERDLREMFGSLGQIQSAKIVTSHSAGGSVYGFVEYVDVASAERAIRTMDGWLWLFTPMKVCWAKNSMHPDAAEGADTERAFSTQSSAGSYHIFVGDLSPEVDDRALQTFFSRFPSLADVRVMYNVETGKSRGFGFISFRNSTDAERCIAVMQGQWLGGRQIRVNWANQKNQGRAPLSTGTEAAYPKPSQQSTTPFSSQSTPATSAFASQITTRYAAPSGSSGFPGLPRRHTALDSQRQPTSLASKFNYKQVLDDAPASLTSVYVGNISPLTSREDLIRIFSPFNHGQPLEARIPAGRGYGFVKLASHEQAASAICTLSIQGVFMHSRWLRFGWQRDRGPGMLPHRSDSAPLLQYKPPDFPPF